MELEVGVDLIDHVIDERVYLLLDRIRVVVGRADQAQSAPRGRLLLHSGGDLGEGGAGDVLDDQGDGAGNPGALTWLHEPPGFCLFDRSCSTAQP